MQHTSMNASRDVRSTNNAVTYLPVGLLRGGQRRVQHCEAEGKGEGQLHEGKAARDLFVSVLSWVVQARVQS